MLTCIEEVKKKKKQKNKKKQKQKKKKKQKQKKIATENSETECFFWEEIFKNDSAEEQNDSCII